MSLNYQDYLSNSQYRSDNENRKRFASDLLLAFKQKNISEGINVVQATALHAFIKEINVTYPPQIHGGWSGKVDLMNCALAGDVETACMSLQFCQVEDMSQPHHWLNAERRDWLVAQMKAWLGWP